MKIFGKVIKVNGKAILNKALVIGGGALGLLGVVLLATSSKGNDETDGEPEAEESSESIDSEESPSED